MIFHLQMCMAKHSQHHVHHTSKLAPWNLINCPTPLSGSPSVPSMGQRRCMWTWRFHRWRLVPGSRQGWWVFRLRVQPGQKAQEGSTQPQVKERQGEEHKQQWKRVRGRIPQFPLRKRWWRQCYSSCIKFHCHKTYDLIALSFLWHS